MSYSMKALMLRDHAQTRLSAFAFGPIIGRPSAPWCDKVVDQIEAGLMITDLSGRRRIRDQQIDACTL